MVQIKRNFDSDGNRFVGDLAHRIIPMIAAAGHYDFVLDPMTGTHPQFSELICGDVYLVCKERLEKAFLKKPTENDVYQWLKGNLYYIRCSGLFIRGWLNVSENRHFLNLSTAIIGRDRAILFARENQRGEIYHFKTSQSFSIISEISETLPLIGNDVVNSELY